MDEAPGLLIGKVTVQIDDSKTHGLRTMGENPSPDGGEGTQCFPADIDDATMRAVRGRNKAFPGAPDDFAICDFIEMEKLGNRLRNARDSWAQCETTTPYSELQQLYGRGTERRGGMAGGRSLMYLRNCRPGLSNPGIFQDPSVFLEEGVRTPTRLEILKYLISLLILAS